MSDSRPTNASFPDLPPGMDALSVGRAAFGAPDLPSPPVVDGFSEISWLGEGGFGRIWRARRDSDGAVTALKIPHQCDAETAERMEQEAGALKALDHPNIVRLYDVTTDASGSPVLVMELVDGPPLTSRLPPHGFDFDHALQIFLPVLDAVAHAHARGIVHRDLKPSNILLAADGTPKVTDFGLAQPLKDQRVAFALTKSGILAGTVEYLAPERYDPTTKAGTPADLYALGVILYELLTGRPPRGAWQPPSQIKRLDVRLDELILDAIRADPARRLPSAEVFRQRLEEIRDSRPRYSGTPLITRPVSAADFIWTVSGLYCLAAGYCTQEAIHNTDVPAIFDLRLGHTHLLGGYWAVWLLTIVMGFGWSWQSFRLWRFRHIPLREALPSPFGLRLGSSGGAGVVVAIAQFLCAWMPVAFIGWICADVWYWATPETAAWERVLAVTRGDSDVPVSPWTWDPAGMFSGDEYKIREMRPGWATETWHLLDRQSFFVFTQPLLMALGAAGIAAGMLSTVVVTIWYWWKRRPFSLLLFLAAIFSGSSWVYLVAQVELANRAGQHRDPAGMARSRQIGWKERHWIPFIKELFDAAYRYPQSKIRIPESELAPVISRGDAGPLDRAALIELVEMERSRDAAERATLSDLREHYREAAPRHVRRDFQFERYTDPAIGLATGSAVTVSFEGKQVEGDDARFVLTEWKTDRQPLYAAEVRQLGPDEARSWLDSLLRCLAGEGCPGLEDLFLPVIIASVGYRESSEREESKLWPCDALIGGLRSSRADWTSLEFASTSVTNPTRLPGARWQFACDLLQSGIHRNGRRADQQPLRWQIEIVFVDGRWKILRLRM